MLLFRLLFKRGLLLLVVLSACASLTKQQCLEGNWQQIGISDGISGYTPDRLVDHAKSCSDVGITPDAKAWERGRQKGLKTYCQPESAYQVGRKGGAIRNVCTAPQRKTMQPAFDRGQNYYEITVQIQALDQQISDIKSEIVAKIKANNGTAPADVFFLQVEINDLNIRILRLEQSQRQYARWP